MSFLAFRDRWFRFRVRWYDRDRLLLWQGTRSMPFVHRINLTGIFGLLISLTLYAPWTLFLMALLLRLTRLLFP